MSFPALTEERLRFHLDSNQAARERMCRAILALDKRYLNVRSRHPKGGPDHGRDIQAEMRDGRQAFAAVGFVNSANDSPSQKLTIKKKFKADLKAALAAAPGLPVFVFFTNVSLTIGEKDQLVTYAYAQGVSECDVQDRERLRISLDGTDGFGLRMQYLAIPLTEAEQASFFGRWGDEIQTVMTSGFERIDTSLDRLLFLQEAEAVLSHITVRFVLDRPYSASEIGHFRAFTVMYLKAIKLNIFGIMFGSSDRSSRFYHQDDQEFLANKPGMEHGFSGGAWEHHLKRSKKKKVDATADGSDPDDGSGEGKWKPTGRSSSASYDPVQMIVAQYDHDDWIRTRKRLRMKDLNGAMVIFKVDENLASKLEAIEVFANGYSLAVYEKADFKAVKGVNSSPMNHRFLEEELAIPWYKIEPAPGYSWFGLDFDANTPRRTYEAHKVAASSKAVTREGKALTG